MNSFKKARLKIGLTQTEVANRLGVSIVTVCKWEKGICFPAVKRINAVADALNTTVDELLDERERMSS